jgi:hypothetical protein
MFGSIELGTSPDGGFGAIRCAATALFVMGRKYDL